MPVSIQSTDTTDDAHSDNNSTCAEDKSTHMDNNGTHADNNDTCTDMDVVPDGLDSETCVGTADDLLDIEQEEDRILIQLMADFMCNLDILTSD